MRRERVEADTRLAPSRLLQWLSQKVLSKRNMSGLPLKADGKGKRNGETRLCASGHGRFSARIAPCPCVVLLQRVLCRARFHAMRAPTQTVDDARAAARLRWPASARPSITCAEGKAEALAFPHTILGVCAAQCSDIEIRPMTKILSPSPDLASVCGSHQ